MPRLGLDLDDHAAVGQRPDDVDVGAEVAQLGDEVGHLAVAQVGDVRLEGEAEDADAGADGVDAALDEQLDGLQG